MVTEDASFSTGNRLNTTDETSLTNEDNLLTSPKPLMKKGRFMDDFRAFCSSSDITESLQPPLFEVAR